jgi:hypothetical protein
MKYKSIVLPVAVWMCVPAAAGAAGASDAKPDITLERIMADPDWIGAPVKNAFWSADSRAVYYSIKRGGSPIVDLHRIDIGDRLSLTQDFRRGAFQDFGDALLFLA